MIPHKPEGVLSHGNPERDIIVGVTSFGSEECDGYMPGVYTRVSSFWSWIEETVRREDAVSPCLIANLMPALTYALHLPFFSKLVNSLLREIS